MQKSFERGQKLRQNEDGFWYNEFYPTEFGGKILKDSSEGKKLTKMIEEKEPQELIDLTAKFMLFRTLSDKGMENYLCDVKKAGFDDGVNHLTSKVRSALGI